MARRDLPYFPLYVQDFLTDEKLIECSAESTGVYIRLLCIMHKSEPYGAVLLKQKYKQNCEQSGKQNIKQIFNFACQIAKQMPFDVDTIARSLDELVSEGVLVLDGDILYQKRMVKDGKTSDIRAKAGKKGGQRSTQKSSSSQSSSSFALGFASDFAQAKIQANSENENDNEFKKEDSNSFRECNGDSNTVDSSKNLEGDSYTLLNPELGRVMEHYLDKVDPTPTTACTQELTVFVSRFGADIVLHAIDRARDKLKGGVNWNYIRGILRGYSREKVQTLEDVFRLEQEFDEAQERKNAQRAGKGKGSGRESPETVNRELENMRKLYENMTKGRDSP